MSERVKAIQRPLSARLSMVSYSVRLRAHPRQAISQSLSFCERSQSTQRNGGVIYDSVVSFLFLRLGPS